MTSRLWYRAVLNGEQMTAGQIHAITQRFAQAVSHAGDPAGACLFATSYDRVAQSGDDADDAGVNVDAVYFSPESISVVPDLIAEYQAEPSEPPDRTRAALLVGRDGDWDLLPRTSH